MTYLVTHGNEPAPGPVALDTVSDLEGALNHARSLLLAGLPNVAIIDGNGNQIGGEDLVACCNETKRITPDLKAVSV